MDELGRDVVGHPATPEDDVPAAEGRAEDFAVFVPQHAATGRIMLGRIVAAVPGPALGAGRTSEKKLPRYRQPPGNKFEGTYVIRIRLSLRLDRGSLSLIGI